MDKMNNMEKMPGMMNKMSGSDMMRMLSDMKAMCRCHDCSTFMSCSSNSQEGLFCGMGGKISCQTSDMGCMPSKMNCMPSSEMGCMSSKMDMPQKMECMSSDMGCRSSKMDMPSSEMGCMPSKMDMPQKMECMCKSCSIASDMGMNDSSFCMNK